MGVAPKTITLTRGIVALVDEEDFGFLNRFTWTADNKGYAVRRPPQDLDGHRIVWRMHRLVLGLADGDINNCVDHINGNKSDNRKENLRVCTHKQNSANRKINKNSSTGLKGVCFHKASRRWVARINANGGRKTLGYFLTPEQAYEAYKKAADEFHAEFANYG